MKATLEFDLDNSKDAKRYELARKAESIHHALKSFANTLKKDSKYGTSAERASNKICKNELAYRYLQTLNSELYGLDIEL